MAMKECIEAHDEYYGAMYKSEGPQEDVDSRDQDEETQKEDVAQQDAVEHSNGDSEPQENHEETVERANNSSHEATVSEVSSEEMNISPESSNEE